MYVFTIQINVFPTFKNIEKLYLTTFLCPLIQVFINSLSKYVFTIQINYFAVYILLKNVCRKPKFSTNWVRLLRESSVVEMLSSQLNQQECRNNHARCGRDIDFSPTPKASFVNLLSWHLAEKSYRKWCTHRKSILLISKWAETHPKNPQFENIPKVSKNTLFHSFLL